MPDLHLKSGEVERVSDKPIRWTNAMDIYEGLYLKKEKVYVKCLRMVDANDDSLRVSEFVLRNLNLPQVVTSASNVR